MSETTTKPRLIYKSGEWIPSSNYFSKWEVIFTVDREYWFQEVSFKRIPGLHHLYIYFAYTDKDAAYKELKEMRCKDMPKDPQELDGWIRARVDIITVSQYIDKNINIEQEYKAMLNEFLNYGVCPFGPPGLTHCNCGCDVSDVEEEEEEK